MKKGAIYYRRKPLSEIIQQVKLLDDDPEAEYLLKTEDLQTGATVWINKTILEAKWKPVTGGVQQKLFLNDQREKYKRIYNHQRDEKNKRK